MKTNVELSADRKTLTLVAKTRRVTIDLRAALRARLYDLAALREFTMDTFEVRLVQPLANGLRVQLVNVEHGLFIPVEFRTDEDGFRGDRQGRLDLRTDGDQPPADGARRPAGVARHPGWRSRVLPAGNLEPVPYADMTTTLQRPGVFENGAYSGYEGIGQNSPPPPGGSS